jgi:hypothetical protein
MRDASRARVVERQPSSGRRKLRQAVALDLGHGESLTGRGEGPVGRIFADERQPFRE